MAGVIRAGTMGNIHMARPSVYCNLRHDFTSSSNNSEESVNFFANFQHEAVQKYNNMSTDLSFFGNFDTSVVLFCHFPSFKIHLLFANGTSI